MRARWLTTVLVAVFAGQAPGADGNRPTFLRDVAPVLDKAGCSAGACHGKFGGAGGFSLSLLTLSPDDDYEAVVGGKRVDRESPADSRFLAKPSGGLEHKGGIRVPEGSPEYRTLLTWLEGGAVRRPDDPKLVDVVVEPARATVPVGGEVRLKVTAKWSDGTTEDVTRKAVFASSDEPVATVTGDGLVKGVRWGATSIQVRFLGRARAAFVAFPRPGDGGGRADVPRANFIDDHVFDNLKALNVVPSELAADGPFCRRVYLDLLGVLPTPGEFDAFVQDSAPDNRVRLVDRLLGRPEYADLRTLRLADLLRLNPQKITPSDNHGTRSCVLFHDWIRDNVAANRPYDAFVRDILTARGKELETGPANYWLIEKQPHDRAETTAQVFLGVRLMCARCHKHPFDRWDTDDYWDFAAAHALVGVKGGSYASGLILGYPQHEVVCAAGAKIRNESVNGPRAGKEAQPKFLGENPLAAADLTGDPVARMADWATAPGNRFFARAAMNRLWSWHFGRGLVTPVDDMRETSPEYVPGLLDALAREFVRSGYDIKHMTRLIVTSRTYQLSSKPNPTNVLDDRFFSRSHARPMPAQVMLDILNQATGTAEKFIGHGSPVGNGDFAVERFVQYPVPFPKAYFLNVFGASKRTFLADVDPKLEPSMLQALHLMNSDYVNDKVRTGAFTRELAKTAATDSEVVERAYLRTFCRRPDEQEVAAALKLRADSPDRKTWVDDLLWSLLTSREFLFNS